MKNNEINNLLKSYESKLKNSTELVKSKDMTKKDKLLYDRMALSDLLDKLGL